MGKDERLSVNCILAICDAAAFVRNIRMDRTASYTFSKEAMAGLRPIETSSQFRYRYVQHD